MIDWLVNALVLIGAAAVIYGISLVSVPAAIIAAGIGLIVVAIAIVRLTNERQRNR